jgi:hypothetical protein
MVEGQLFNAATCLKTHPGPAAFFQALLEKVQEAVINWARGGCALTSVKGKAGFLSFGQLLLVAFHPLAYCHLHGGGEEGEGGVG